MAEENRFFRWVYRLVGLGALLGLVAVAGLFVTTMLIGGNWAGGQTAEVQAMGAEPGAPTERLRFFGLESLKGTGMQMVMVGVQDDDGFGKRVSSSYSSAQTRNVVFFAPGGGQATWLFPGNDQHILGVEKLCVCSGKDDDRVLGLYLEIESSPADDDGRVQPALVRPDGSGYRALTPGPVRVLGNETDGEAGRVGLLMEVEGRLVFRQYALTDFSQVSEQTVAALPGA